MDNVSVRFEARTCVCVCVCVCEFFTFGEKMPSLQSTTLN